MLWTLLNTEEMPKKCKRTLVPKKWSSTWKDSTSVWSSHLEGGQGLKSETLSRTCPAWGPRGQSSSPSQLLLSVRTQGRSTPRSLRTYRALRWHLSESVTSSASTEHRYCSGIISALLTVFVSVCFINCLSLKSNIVCGGQWGDWGSFHGKEPPSRE